MKTILALLLCVTLVYAAEPTTEQPITSSQLKASLDNFKNDIAKTVAIETLKQRDFDVKDYIDQRTKLTESVNKLIEDKLSSLKIETDKKLSADEKRTALEAEFAGLSWGMGVSWTLDNKNNRVNKAEVIDSLVRVTDEDNVKVRLLAELHYFFELPTKWQEKYGTTCHWGPFVAIDTQDFKKLDGAGGGVMLGFRNEKVSKSFNIGIGWMVDQNSKELGTGLEEGKPLPAGAKDLWYKTRSQGGMVLITSFTFEL